VAFFWGPPSHSKHAKNKIIVAKLNALDLTTGREKAFLDAADHRGFDNKHDRLKSGLKPRISVE
jgi:hypothetical protein